MEHDTAISCLGALAQPTRLAVFRLLIQAGPDGLPAGDIARRTNSLPNTLSKNLSVLSAAGLISGHRMGRVITYRAEIDQMSTLLAYLMEDCCGGDPALCGPMLDTTFQKAPST